MTDREVLLLYLQIMVEREDWHGVRDAAADLEVLDAVEKTKDAKTP